MESRQSPRPQWTERLQVAMLQVALVLALLSAFNGSGRAQAVEAGACTPTRAAMATPDVPSPFPTRPLPPGRMVAASAAAPGAMASRHAHARAHARWREA